MIDSSAIEKLIDWQGGWAARALFDDAVNRYLNKDRQNIELAGLVIKNSSGLSAIRYLKKYCKLTGVTLDISGITENLSSDIKQIINLGDIVNIPHEITVDFWLEKLCEHLDTNRENLTSKINQSLIDDDYPTGNPNELIESWSFPVISDLLPLSVQQKAIVYVEDEIAKLCWKRWYLTPERKVLLLETHDRTNLKSSQWLVWRLLHDATHLLHLQNFPEAGCYLDPTWLLTLEAAAMTVEKQFLGLIEHRVKIPKPINYSLNLFNVKTILLIGLLERSLRLEYDLAVHLRRQPIASWITQTKRQTGFNLNCYDFVREFHGLPGFCAGYMIGLNAIESEPDKVPVLCGKKSLKFLPLEKDDELSKSALTDIPARLPQHPIYIQAVGTSDTTCFFNLLNPFTNKYNQVEAKAYVTVDLSPHQRGIHMSRLQEILNNLDTCDWDKLEDVTDFVAQEARKVQNSKRSEVNFVVNSYVETLNHRSKTRSKQPIKIIANTIFDGTVISRTIGLIIKVMTACPCTLKFSSLKTEKNLKLSLHENFFDSIMQAIPPTFTHAQRGTLYVKVSSHNPKHLISPTNLYSQISRVAHLVEAVLKRPDEHYLVQKSHRKPQFCEDLCREVAVAVASQVDANDLVEVSAELDESIHPHKAFAKLTIKASDAWYINSEND
ncbi:GTP cyclohydrolase, FolE2/MptA family [Coleofasciculus sp. E1-EBD-02]|uniref:GTP cyclohydrolase, FolE2/MptA family n=1 Tax=Coleofasciculus sp. E1-EBD-02 TaxID=3068481 RepID=UPI0032F52F2A